MNGLRQVRASKIIYLVVLNCSIWFSTRNADERSGHVPLEPRGAYTCKFGTIPWRS